MLARVIAGACFVALFCAGVATAQTNDPSELPAADYQGQSYVDSKGCIFLKAGYGGNASWVPRVGQDRKPICGQMPTNAAAGTTAAPALSKSRKKKAAVRVATQPAPVKIGCAVSVPVARRYATTDGGSVVICTAQNGSLTGARSPIYPAGSDVGAALSKTQTAGVAIPLPDASSAATPSVAKSGRYYVQVGTFALPSNAERASARVTALGLPVSHGKFTKQGHALQVIYAGPFASGVDAQAALGAARNSGFSDAYIP